MDDETRAALGADDQARIALLERAVAEQTERLRRARKGLRRCLPGQTKTRDEEAQEEVDFAVDDLAFARKQLREEMLRLMPSHSVPDVFVESQEQYQTEHEKRRKAAREKEIGAALSWDEYWAYLEKEYYPQLEVEAKETYEQSVRGYGWEFDSSRDDGKFPSDLGTCHYGADVRNKEQVELNIKANKNRRKGT